MRYLKFIVLILLSFNAASEPLNQNPQSISSTELQDFNLNPAEVKSIINLALELAGKDIKYQYGSADPNIGGMDCSGTIHYLLTQKGVKNVPRSSHLQYQWVVEKGHFYSVNDHATGSLRELSHLKPGDLLFWNGTYQVEHDPNVTHVMIYIGKNKQGQALMAGASNGRSYQGRKIYGVSVFDFQFPEKYTKGHFLGYSCIPSINC